MVSDATIAFLGMLDTDRAAGKAHPIAPFHLLRSPHVPARTRSNRGRSGKRCRWPSQFEIPAWQIIRHRTGFKPGRPATQIARCRRGDKRHPHQVVFLEFLVEAPLSTGTSNFQEARLRWQHIARQHDFSAASVPMPVACQPWLIAWHTNQSNVDLGPTGEGTRACLRDERMIDARHLIWPEAVRETLAEPSRSQRRDVRSKKSQ